MYRKNTNHQFEYTLNLFNYNMIKQISVTVNIEETLFGCC